MSDVIEKKVVDNYEEHKFHDKYDKQCSTCFNERLDCGYKCGLAYTGDSALNGLPEFIGTKDQWEAFDHMSKKTEIADDDYKYCKFCGVVTEDECKCNTCENQYE